MGTFNISRLSKQFNKNRNLKTFQPKVIDHLAQAGIRIGFTRDLRKDLALPGNTAYLSSLQKFNSLFNNDPRIIRREIINWNLVERESESSPCFLPDEQTGIHLNYLYDCADRPLFCNLVNYWAARYLANPLSRVYSFMRGRNFESVSLHLGFSAEELGRDPRDNHSIPKVFPAIEPMTMGCIFNALFDLKKNLAEVGFGGKLMVETLDYQTDHVDGKRVTAYKYVTEPDFVAEVLKGIGFDLLLDVAHLLISAHNMGGYSSPLEYAERMLGNNAGRLHEIHVAVPEQTEERWLDNHRPLYNHLESEEAAETLRIFEFLLNKRVADQPLLINLETPADTVHLDAIVLVMFLKEIMGF